MGDRWLLLGYRLRRLSNRLLNRGSQVGGRPCGWHAWERRLGLTHRWLSWVLKVWLLAWLNYRCHLLLLLLLLL